MLLASLAINLLSLGLPMVILQVYDRILPNEALGTLTFLILGLCGVLILDGLFRVARATLAAWKAAHLEHGLGCRAVECLLGADIQDFEKEAPGVHLDRLYAVDQLREYHAGQARLVIADLPFVALFLGLIWYIGGGLVLIPLTCLVALTVTSLWLGVAIRRAIRARVNLDHRRYSFIIEVLGRMHTVKMLAMESLLLRRYELLQKSGAVGTYKTTMLANLTLGMGALFSNLVMVSVAAVGATSVIAETLSIGGLAACTLLAGRSVQPLLRGMSIWTQLQNVAVARERLSRLFALKPESRGEATPLEDVRGAIEVRNVTFGYDPEAPLLKDIDLEIAPGEVIGISGGTGKGKTSLLMVISGLLEPQRGQILLDGIDHRDRDPGQLRENIGFFPQNPVLFRGTIMDNLTLFEEGERLDAALAAAKSVGLHDVVHRLPAGYETEVGDGAMDQLPKGTSQAITVARSLAGGHPVILFDEANSAFDSEADTLLREELAALKGQATMVLVSHRPSLLALSDRRYDLEDGRLVQREEDETARQGRTVA